MGGGCNGSGCNEGGCNGSGRYENAPRILSSETEDCFSEID